MKAARPVRRGADGKVLHSGATRRRPTRLTDALKRALRSYGDQFGNSLYGDGATGDLAPSLRTTLVALGERRGFDEATVRSAVRERTGRDLDELPAAALTPLVEAAARKLQQEGAEETPKAA